jgi:hypothetical protein
MYSVLIQLDVNGMSQTRMFAHVTFVGKAHIFTHIVLHSRP